MEKRAEGERREQEALEKRIADQLEKEHKADEEQEKRDEVRRNRRKNSKKRRREEAALAE